MGAQARKAPAEKEPASPKKPPGFLERLFALFESGDPERQKQRKLREIAIELKRSRSRMYNPAKGTAEPGLARFFWEIYKSVAAAQVLLQGAQGSGALKLALIDLSLTEEQLLLKERLTARSIAERAGKGADPAAIDTEVSQDLRTFLDSIDTNWMNEIDALFNRLLVLLDLIGFDYFFLLKKFDPGLPERDFSYIPHFGAIDAALVQDELQDFLEILPSVDPDADWDRVLSVLKEHRGIEVMAKDAQRKMLQAVRDARRSGILLLIVRHLMQNPDFRSMVRTHRERIVEPFISKLKAEAETTAQKVAHGKRAEKLAELVRQVFGSDTVSHLNHYSEESNPEYAQKMLGGFLYVAALAYLRTFLVDYLPRNIREVVDLLIVKGKWANNLPSQQMSEAFHQLLTMSEAIGRFDEDLAENGERGRKLKTIAMRADRDRKAIVQLRAALQQVNDEARAMLGDATQHLIDVARVLKLAYEDIGKPNPAALVNWKELKPGTERDLRTLVATVYKKIYSFVQLMQMYR